MNIVKTICLSNNLLTHIKENTHFPWQKLSVEANFED